MPIYSWKCPLDHRFETVSTVASRNDSTSCPECSSVDNTRQITAAVVSETAKDWNRQGYNPGLGCWTSSWKQGREIAKHRGLEEVGNTTPKEMVKTAKETREATYARRWKTDGGPLL